MFELSVRGQKGMLAIIAVAFLLGVTGSRAYDHYTRGTDCKRWQENVTRWCHSSRMPLGN